MPIMSEEERRRGMLRGDTGLVKRSKSMFERDLGTRKQPLIIEIGNVEDPDTERRRRLGQAGYSQRQPSKPQPTDLGPFGNRMITSSSVRPMWSDPDRRWGELRNRNRFS